jgi:lipopolysaccharide/colanic/teichoic acid biosynthesis glycosyltransferase
MALTSAVGFSLAAPTGDGVALPTWVLRHPVRTRPSSGYRISKRCLDIAAAGALSVLTLPIVAVSAMIVRATSPDGPAFYRQQRTGQHGERFTIVKLRTMVPDADARRDDLAHLNSRTWPDFKIVDDPRVTRFGRFLRATSIDELPQLWAIAVGSMSLVGPRPTSMTADKYADWQHVRLRVPAGLTGLWQVIARDDPSFDVRVHLDAAYIERRSFLLDAEILLRTVPAVLRARSGR